LPLHVGPQILGSLAHMGCNRVLGSEAADAEFVVYMLMRQSYRTLRIIET